MRRLISNIGFIVLASCSLGTAWASKVEQSSPLRHVPTKKEFHADLCKTNEATKQSYTEQRSLRAVKQFSASPVVPFAQENPRLLNDRYVIVDFHRQFSQSSFYSSSLSNKAPPIL